MARAMKDSGIEWIGEIPQGWDIRNLFQIFNQVKCKNAGLVETNLLSLSYGRIKRKSIDTVEGLLPESFDGYNIVEENDIVLRLTDLQNDHTSLRVGRCTERGIITSAYLTIRPYAGLNSNFLYYALHSFDICKGFYGMGAGVRQGLNWEGVKHLKLAIPNFDEQSRICGFLDRRCAEIDSVIAQTQKTIEEYKALKQSIITEAVTKGIRPNRPMKDSGIEWIGDMPEDWSVAKLKNLCRTITDGTHFSPETTDEGFPYVTAKDVHGIGIDYSATMKISEDDFRKLQKAGCQIENGDVLIVKDGATTGRTGLVTDDVPCVILSSVAMLRTTDDVVNRYLYYLLQSEMIQEQIRVSMAGSAMPRITLKKIVAFIALLLPLAEQVEICNYLDRKVEEIDSLIAAKQQLLTELETYKKSVIYEYVTGKKEVPVCQ